MCSTWERRVRLEFVEGMEGQIDASAGPCREVTTNLIVPEGEHAAAGVLDDDDLLGAEELLDDDERAGRIVSGQTTGAADDVGIAGPQCRTSSTVSRPSMQARTASLRPGGRGSAERSNWGGITLVLG